MHPDECRSTHLLLLPPTLLRSITWRPVKVNNLHTIHNDPPPSTQSWERFAKSFQSFSFNFPPLSFSSKNSLRKIHSPLRTHTRYIILIFRLSSSSPSQFSLTVIIHHPSILLRTLPQRNLVAPLHGALFHSPIPGELSVSVRHTGWMPKRSSTGSTGEAVWLIPWRGLARIRQDPLWRRVWDEAGRNRVPRETRGGRDRPTRDVSPLPPRPTANGHPRLAPPSTWRTVDTAAFNRWRCAVSPSLFHHGRLSPLSLSLSVRLLLSLSQSRHSHDCRASVAQIIVTIVASFLASFARWSTRVRPTLALCSLRQSGQELILFLPLDGWQVEQVCHGADVCWNSAGDGIGGNCLRGEGDDGISRVTCWSV